MEDIIRKAIDGAQASLSTTRTLLDQLASTRPQDTPIGFPDTAYFLPLTYAVLGLEPTCLQDLDQVVTQCQATIAGEYPQDVDRALAAGTATLILAEIIAAIRYLVKEEPQSDCEGFITDRVLRSLGLHLVSGRVPGFAIIVGA
ncbi:MAG: hypothetical protein D3910_18710, partial [Candidatus Electrothrix sp. ATG2]|nr:hypothetical protein [Candidatus Electrothrix sp. ATG2]